MGGVAGSVFHVIGLKLVVERVDAAHLIILINFCFAGLEKKYPCSAVPMRAGRRYLLRHDGAFLASTARRIWLSTRRVDLP